MDCAGKPSAALIVTLATGAVVWTGLFPVSDVWGRSMQWADDERLVVLAKDPDAPAMGALTGAQTQERLVEKWTETREGRPGVTLLGAGRYLDRTPSAPPGRLTVVDADTGQGRVLAQGAFIDLEVAPGGRRAAMLAEAETPIRLFPLAATRKAAIDESQRAELSGWSPVGAMLAEMILGYDDHVTGAGWPLHDAMVVASLLESGLVDLREAAAVEVDTTTGPHRGATDVIWDDARPARAPLEVAVDADPERFRELLRERIGSLV